MKRFPGWVEWRLAVRFWPTLWSVLLPPALYITRSQEAGQGGAGHCWPAQ